MSETKIPGIKAKHCFIPDVCRTNRGDDGALEEALERIRQEYHACRQGWPVGKGAEFHIALTIKKP